MSLSLSPFFGRYAGDAANPTEQHRHVSEEEEEETTATSASTDVDSVRHVQQVQGPFDHV